MLQFLAGLTAAGLLPLGLLGGYAALGGGLATFDDATHVKYAVAILASGAAAARLGASGTSPWKIGLLSGLGPTVWYWTGGSPETVPLSVTFLAVAAVIGAFGAVLGRLGRQATAHTGHSERSERAATAAVLAFIAVVSMASADWFTRTVYDSGGVITVPPTDPIPVLPR